eukprot:CAMPEP_0115185250 /NCGR_PEP_ID=MMETSP0270-20121206/9374_1 /TAXON_ID=71861 /ORGANISM="Scrippsiella trochoidea, Strain CCMP3099" /LENGTH=124 /DNA_ID=CAMNT_0002598347 /DNA_START=1354 /DNA_END=1729 /DNA_ORIENTATION=-
MIWRLSSVAACHLLKTPLHNRLPPCFARQATDRSAALRQAAMSDRTESAVAAAAERISAANVRTLHEETHAFLSTCIFATTCLPSKHDSMPSMPRWQCALHAGTVGGGESRIRAAEGARLEAKL